MSTTFIDKEGNKYVGVCYKDASILKELEEFSSILTERPVRHKQFDFNFFKTTMKDPEGLTPIMYNARTGKDVTIKECEESLTLVILQVRCPEGFEQTMYMSHDDWFVVNEHGRAFILDEEKISALKEVK